MKYIVYCTINKNNNKIYVGVHKTENPDIFDEYIGCGAHIKNPSSYRSGKTHFHRAILKYGINSFYRLTIKVFNTLEEALLLEKELVTESFIKRTDTYNMTNGGNNPPILSKTVYEFSLQGDLIKEWDSIIEITKTFNCNKDRVAMCIKDKRSFNNSYWSETNSINIEEYRLSSRGYVYLYNKEGLLLNIFENSSIAALKLDIDKQSINNSIFNRTSCCGYYFLKADEDINLLLDNKVSRKRINTTPIYRYLENGNFDKSYDSISKAILDTKITNYKNIVKAIKNNKSYGGFRWSYIKEDSLLSYKTISPIKIAQYDLDHNLVKIWDTVSSCKKEFPSCLKVCRKERKSTKNFIFEYIS